MSKIEEQPVDRPVISYGEMEAMLNRAFGERGIETARAWQAYNTSYFDSRLEPVPIFHVAATPDSRWWGLCTGSWNQRRVANIQIGKAAGDGWRETLLHEMVHQALFEAGLVPGHDGEPWRNEIMRISRDHFGVEFWAGAYTVAKIRREPGRRISIRVNKSGPAGEASLPQSDIAHWPRSVGITAPVYTELRRDRLAWAEGDVVITRSED